MQKEAIVLDMARIEERDYNKVVEAFDRVYEKIDGKVAYFIDGINTDELWNSYLKLCRESGIGHIYKKRQVQDCSICRQALKYIFRIVIPDSGELRTIFDFILDELDKGNVYYKIFEELNNEIKRKVSVENLIRMNRVPNTPREAGGFVHFYIKDIFKRNDPQRIISLHRFLEKIKGITLNEIYDVKDLMFRFNDFEYLFRDYLSLTDKDLIDLLEIEIPEYLTTSTAVASFLEIFIEDKDRAIDEWNKFIDPYKYMKRKEKELTEKEAERLINELLSKYDFEFRIMNINDFSLSELLYVDRRVVNIDEKTKRLLDLIKTELKKDELKIDVEKIPKIKFEELLNMIPDIDEMYLFVNECMEKAAWMGSIGSNIITKRRKYVITEGGNATTKNEVLREVEKHGGVIDAPFVCSIWWATGCDYDLHLEVNGGVHHVYYHNKKKNIDGSVFELDIDMNVFDPNIPAVENIYSYSDILPDGEYLLYIHNIYYRGCGDDKTIKVFLRIPGYGDLSLETEKQLNKGEKLEICRFKVKDGRIIDMRVNDVFKSKYNNNAIGWFERVSFIMADEYNINNIFIATENETNEIEFYPFSFEHLKYEVRVRYGKVLQKIMKKMKFPIDKKSAIGYIVRKDMPFIVKVKFRNGKQKVFLVSE